MPHARSRDARGSVADAPDPFGYRTIVFFTNQAISRREVCQPAAPRTLADPASSPRSIRRLSPRARRSAPSSVISRYVSASRREPPNLPPPRPDMFLPPGVLSVSQEEPDGGLSGSFRAAAPRWTRARRRSHARRLGEGNRAFPRPRRSGVARGSRGRAPCPPPRVHVGAMDAVGRSIQTDTAQIGVRSATRRSFRCDVAVSADFFL